MKTTTYLLHACLFLWAAGILLPSCDSMDSIQEEYASREETVYLGKVDSLTSVAGIGEVKFIYWIGADPRIEQTVVYWNVRADSLVKDFIRTGPGKQKDSVTISGLEPGTYQFEFRNKNARGEYSLYSQATGTILSE